MAVSEFSGLRRVDSIVHRFEGGMTRSADAKYGASPESLAQRGSDEGKDEYGDSYVSRQFHHVLINLHAIQSILLAQVK